MEEFSKTLQSSKPSHLIGCCMQSSEAAWAWTIKYVPRVPDGLNILRCLMPRFPQLKFLLLSLALNVKCHGISVCCCHIFSSDVDVHADQCSTLTLNALLFMINVFFCYLALRYSNKFFPFLFSEEFTCLETVNTRLCSFHSAKSTAAANNASHDCTYGSDAKPVGSAHSREGDCNCNKYSPTTCNQPNSAYTSWC